MKLYLFMLLAALITKQINSLCSFDQRKEKLQCTNTDLREMQSFNQKDAVRELIVTNSIIQELPNRALPFPNIRKVTLQCKLQKLNSGSFRNLQKLEALDLSENEITSIPLDLFEDLKFLTALSLKRNQLPNPTLDTFYGLNSLNSLDISNNRITYMELGVMDEMKSLQRLIIANNAIIDIPLGFFDELTNLQLVNLAGNHLSKWPLGLLDKSQMITHLDISHNRFNEIPLGTLDSLVNLKEIKLNDNKINVIINGVFDELKLLTTIDLSYNNITTLTLGTFNNLKMLSYFNVSHNLLEQLPTHLFDENVIKVIDLSFNKLKVLQNDLINCEDVYLNNNEISILDVKTLASRTFPVHFIDVRFNKLAYIEAAFFDRMVNLKRFEIGGNPWHCPCLRNLMNLLSERYVEYTTKYYFDGERPSCIVTDLKVCDYKIVDRTEFEKAVVEYEK